MSELEKAKQIAAEAFNFKSRAYTTIEQQNEIIEVNRKAFMQILSLSSLTIPKSIADTLDIAIKGLTEFEDYLWAVDEFDVLVPYDRAEYFRKWSNEEMNAHALAVSYVTGKALGVDLVKVVEG